MTRDELSRRGFLGTAAGLAAAAALPGLGQLACNSPRGRETAVKLLVLGLDGMDPQLLQRMMAAGDLPAFTRLAHQGHFGRLGTSNPPQSPVAWSNFIAGASPQVHGIFDFIHRDPQRYMPYLSASRARPATSTISLGNYVIPLVSGGVDNLRRGPAFWQILEQHEVPATIYKMPANYPPSATEQRTLSGMGTPDLLGGYGEFLLFTDGARSLAAAIGGGKVVRVRFDGDSARAQIPGPPDTLRRDSPQTMVPLAMHRDRDRDAARIDLGGESCLLRRGEWSPWISMAFPLALGMSVRGMLRFYLRQAHPTFELYASPINVDPVDAAFPISTPESYAAELARRFGPYATKGLPADTKALEQGVLDEEAFLAMDRDILAERLAVLDFELSRFQSGMLFFYVSSVDQRTHMFWRLLDPKHPAHDAKLAARFGDVVRETYQEMDRMLARVLARIDKRTQLLVLSDHGFSPYYRSFHLNSWLLEQGYLHLLDPKVRGEREFLANVDWTRTKAYALGLNGLYINEFNREAQGIVLQAEKVTLLKELSERLTRVRDPVSGQRVVADATPCTAYSAAHPSVAPDIVVGYSRGFRASWHTALGKIPHGIIETNHNRWSGDHCMACEQLPGILLSNRPLPHAKSPALPDVTATILATFGIRPPRPVQGRTLV